MRMQGTNGCPRELLTQIVGDITRLYPSGLFDLYLHSRGSQRSQSFRDDTPHVTEALARFCAQFPDALVRFSPEDAYGSICTIVCDCRGTQKACPTMCRSGGERPHAVLLLVHDGQKDVLIGKHEAPRN